jgi:hypothetical protein
MQLLDLAFARVIGVDTDPGIERPGRLSRSCFFQA